MKETLELMARYNKTVNEELFALLEKQDRELLTADARSYFTDILGLLNHILVSDLGWLSAYREGNIDLPVLETDALEYEHPGFGKNLYDTLDPLWEHRQTVDQLFIDLIDSTSDEVLSGTIELKRKDRVHAFPFGKIILHLFNHQTHHRGAVSQILDEHGIKNDYSNLLRLLM
jgi:uncharacterized damage-inducible protein DinB